MPLPSGGVYVTGNIVLDLLVRPVEALPPWGTTAMVESIAQHLGGNGAITACALGKLGTPVRLAGAVGDDAFGEFLLARLRSAGVDVSGVRVAAGAGTATTTGLINRRGERLFLHALGASGAVDPWDPTGRWIQDFAAFCPHLDCLFVNQDEARMLAGTSEPVAVGGFFRGCAVRMVVLKMAERGCAVLGEEDFTVPAFSVSAVDTTGAGDSFCGGFLAALRRGYSLREAARFANAVAAQVVERMGGTEGLAGFEQTVARMATMTEKEMPSC